jgi:putative intracellular protease/amidase
VEAICPRVLRTASSEAHDANVVGVLPATLFTSAISSKWHSDRAFAEATSASEKELLVVPGGTHMSLYDRDVGKAMPKLIEFYGKHLKQAAI